MSQPCFDFEEPRPSIRRWMTKFRSTVYMVVTLAFMIATVAEAGQQQESNPLNDLKAWLGETDRPNIEEQSWAKSPLTKQQATDAKQMLWDDHLETIKRERKKEWEDKVIRIGDLEMKFDYRTFGEADENGPRLFISMHGGGGAPKRVNDQQWENQIGLYEPAEGIYLAPRAPTDTWNLWHESHIDKFFERIIQDAVAFESVDPNRVYIMGYSAGGDGVYQLAPRMADRLAAAAMMAGHPNDASALGLRNIGFTLHMGGDDAAYKRNEVAREWKKKLADLQESDPDGYQHDVVIHEGKGHWMNREDAVAVPWMSEFTRNPYPAKVVWFQSGVTHEQFYWLAVSSGTAIGGAKVVARVEDRSAIHIDEFDKVEKLRVLMSDDLVDLDQAITFHVAEKQVQSSKPERTIATLVRTLHERGDVNLMFSAEIELELK